MSNENLLFDPAWIPLAESLPTNRRYPFVLAIFHFLQTGENTFGELSETEQMYFAVIRHKLASNARKQKSSEIPVGQGRPVRRGDERGDGRGDRRPLGRPRKVSQETRQEEHAEVRNEVLQIAESA